MKPFLVDTSKLVSNHCECEMEIKLKGCKWYAFKVWLSKKIFYIAVRLLMARIKINITRDI
jgi:hypothetical protein